MPKALFFLFCLPFSLLASASGVPGGSNLQTTSQAVQNKVLLQTTRFNNSPYFNENYRFADILMVKGRKFINVKARIDLFNQTIAFVANDIEAMLEPGSVRELSYRDTTESGIISYRFRTGYPAIDNKTPNNFYIVLADGKCALLRSVEKRLTQRKNEISGQVFNDYETIENYFLFSKGEMKHLKKDKDFILSELADKQQEVNKFIQDNKLNLRNNDHLVKLLEYYNGL